MRLGFVGGGKVGQTLARLWRGAGYPVTAVAGRTVASVHQLASMVDADALDSPTVVVHRADLIFLTVPDDALAPLAISLAKISDERLSKVAFVHTSGVHPAAVLKPLADRGAKIAGLHPAYPFADVERAVVGLPGALFAVEAEYAALRSRLVELVEAIDGHPLILQPEQKPLYHAALVFASNYTVTLYAVAVRLLANLNEDKAEIAAALNALMRGTSENLTETGLPDALTGPLVRGDVGTIEAHLQALAAADADLKDAYTMLAQLTLPVLHERGIATDAIESILKRDIHEPSDDS